MTASGSSNASPGSTTHARGTTVAPGWGWRSSARSSTAHGGTITVDEPPGATFTVILPLDGIAAGPTPTISGRIKETPRHSSGAGQAATPHHERGARRRHGRAPARARSRSSCLVFGNGGHTALSDLPRVLLHRQITPGAPPYLVRPLEYPVLSGLMLYGADLVWPTALGAFLVTAIAAGACCVFLTIRFARRFGSRAWRWALAVPLLLYAFQNWDMFAIAALVLGLFAFEQRRNRAAGIALGIGAGIKLFPLVVVPVLAAIRWREGRRDEARRLLVERHGHVPRRQSARRRARTAPLVVDLRVPVAPSGDMGQRLVLPLPCAATPRARRRGRAARERRRAGALLGEDSHGSCGTSLRHDIDQFAAAAAAVAIFILSNKVYSPTYDVWLVAFFVMVPFSRRLWLTFCAVDLAVFVTVYGYFHQLHSAGGRAHAAARARRDPHRDPRRHDRPIDANPAHPNPPPVVGTTDPSRRRHQPDDECHDRTRRQDDAEQGSRGHDLLLDHQDPGDDRR